MNERASEEHGRRKWKCQITMSSDSTWLNTERREGGGKGESAGAGCRAMLFTSAHKSALACKHTAAKRQDACVDILFRMIIRNFEPQPSITFARNDAEESCNINVTKYSDSIPELQHTITMGTKKRDFDETKG